jgi:hypothetical protein
MYGTVESVLVGLPWGLAESRTRGLGAKLRNISTQDQARGPFTSYYGTDTVRTQTDSETWVSRMLKEDLGRIWNSLKRGRTSGLKTSTCALAHRPPRGRVSQRNGRDMIVQKKKKRSQLFRIRDVRPYFTAADADSTR